MLLQLLVDGLPDHAVFLIGIDGRVKTWNAGAHDIKGYRPDEIIGRHYSTFFTPQDVARGKPELALKTARERGRYTETGVRVRKDGSTFVAQILLIPVMGPGGRMIGFGKLTRDVTAQIEAAERDSRLRHFLDVVIETMIDGLAVLDQSGTVTKCNRACARIFGYQAEEIVGKEIGMLMPGAALDAYAFHPGFQGQAREPGAMGMPREVGGRRKDGMLLWLRVSIGESELEGEIIYVAVIHDLTERKRIEANLWQAQRLEAIGQLTGGVAHDFNNILMVITATAEDLHDTLPDTDSREQLGRILSSTQRAADLTNRLLAFARKQPLRPLVSDINDLVVTIGKMLARTLGETIDLTFRLGNDLWWASVDRAQFEAAILNLAINARDAMPGGGTLRVETRNVTLGEPLVNAMDDVHYGDYVLIAVSDTGTGIPKETLHRVFEPFFTTKDVGKGTGLGLSMVYGFVKQSGGHIEIDSEVGAGTSVRLYLPRSLVSPDDAESGTDDIPRGDERILAVEDDPHVLTSVAAQLAALGYVVSTARGGAEALAILDTSPIDLLITDVVMPGPLDGPSLVRTLRSKHPDFRVLFISGYAQYRSDHGPLEGNLLNKPFKRRDLALAVRAALDAALAGHPSASPAKNC